MEAAVSLVKREPACCSDRQSPVIASLLGPAGREEVALRPELSSPPRLGAPPGQEYWAGLSSCPPAQSSVTHCLPAWSRPQERPHKCNERASKGNHLTQKAAQSHYQQCDLGQITQPRWALVSASLHRRMRRKYTATGSSKTDTRSWAALHEQLPILLSETVRSLSRKRVSGYGWKARIF